MRFEKAFIRNLPQKIQHFVRSTDVVNQIGRIERTSRFAYQRTLRTHHGWHHDLFERTILWVIRTINHSIQHTLSHNLSKHGFVTNELLHLWSWCMFSYLSAFSNFTIGLLVPNHTLLSTAGSNGFCKFHYWLWGVLYYFGLTRSLTLCFSLLICRWLQMASSWLHFIISIVAWKPT